MDPSRILWIWKELPGFANGYLTSERGFIKLYGFVSMCKEFKRSLKICQEFDQDLWVCRNPTFVQGLFALRDPTGNVFLVVCVLVPGSCFNNVSVHMLPMCFSGSLVLHNFGGRSTVCR